MQHHLNFITNNLKITIMKTSENGVAKLQELSISEMKQINGGGYMIVIIDGKKVVIEI